MVTKYSVPGQVTNEKKFFLVLLIKYGKLVLWAGDKIGTENWFYGIDF